MTKYLEILFRYRLRFAIAGLLVPAALSAGAIVLFPSSQASAAIWVDTPNFFGVSPTVTSGWNQYLTPSQNTADQMSQLIRTDTFLAQLDGQLQSTGAYANDSERKETIGSIGTDLRATQSGSHLVIVIYTCRRAALCTSVVSATIEIYRQSLANQRQTLATAAINFYSAQLNDARNQLKNDQDALNRYLAGHPNVKYADAPLIPDFSQLIQAVNNDQLTQENLQSKLDAVRFQSSASADVNNTIFTVVDPPRPSQGRISSLPKKQLAMVWVGCLALSAAWLTLLAWLDRTARDPRELERRLRVPVVAEIPVMTAQERF